MMNLVTKNLVALACVLSFLHARAYSSDESGAASARFLTGPAKTDVAGNSGETSSLRLTEGGSREDGSGQLSQPIDSVAVVAPDANRLTRSHFTFAPSERTAQDQLAGRQSDVSAAPTGKNTLRGEMPMVTLAANPLRIRGLGQRSKTQRRIAKNRLRDIVATDSDSIGSPARHELRKISTTVDADDTQVKVRQAVASSTLPTPGPSRTEVSPGNVSLLSLSRTSAAVSEKLIQEHIVASTPENTELHVGNEGKSSVPHKQEVEEPTEEETEEEDVVTDAVPQNVVVVVPSPPASPAVDKPVPGSQPSATDGRSEARHVYPVTDVGTHAMPLQLEAQANRSLSTAVEPEPFGPIKLAQRPVVAPVPTASAVRLPVSARRVQVPVPKQIVPAASKQRFYGSTNLPSVVPNPTEPAIPSTTPPAMPPALPSSSAPPFANSLISTLPGEAALSPVPVVVGQAVKPTPTPAQTIALPPARKVAVQPKEVQGTAIGETNGNLVLGDTEPVLELVQNPIGYLNANGFGSTFVPESSLTNSLLAGEFQSPKLFKCDRSFNTTKTKWPCSQCGEVNCCCRPKKWRVRTDALWLQRSRADGFDIPLIRKFGNGIRPTIDCPADAIAMGMRGARQFTVIRDSICEGCDVEATYYMVDEWIGRDSVNGDVATVGFTSIGFGFASVDYESRLQNAEFNFYRDLNNWTKGLIGFRWMQFDEQARVFARTDLTPNFDQRVDTENNLFGVQLGVRRSLWDQGGAWTVDATAKGGVYNNRIDRTTVGFGTSPLSVDRVAFVGELNIDSHIELSQCWTLDVGYRLLWATRVAEAIDQFFAPDEIYDDGDPFLHGFRIGLTRTF